MKKSEFKSAVLSGLKNIAANGNYKLEPIKEKKTFVEKYGTMNAVFAYARWTEMNLKQTCVRIMNARQLSRVISQLPNGASALNVVLH